MEHGTVTVRYHGAVIPAERGQRLSDALGIDLPCGGHGRCGKCRVYARGGLSAPSENERAALSEAELKNGVRLACCAILTGDCEVEPLGEAEANARIVSDGAMDDLSLSPAFSRYGAAIDIGTTTVAARLYAADGTMTAEASMMNPQSPFGADVISRMEAAIGGKGAQLAQAIRRGLDRLLLTLAGQAGILPTAIDGAVITGNTAMLYLLTETSTEPLSHAPFTMERAFGESLTAEELGLSALSAGTAIYLAPCISAFVGGDTVCAILATGMCKRTDTVLLADIGTNGEIALWSGGSLSVCSTAAGPAFEGVGISMGMRGADGAIDRVTIVNGALSAHVLGGGRAKGICGSGLVDAVAAMLDLEIIDETGYMEDDPSAVSDTVSLTGKDIRMVQLAKSAISAGMRTLLREASVSPRAVGELLVAGGFGSYLNAENAMRIGLLPEELRGRIRTVGNAALGGASMLLLSVSLRNEAESLARSAVTTELSTNAAFSEYYMTGMLF